MVKLLKVPNTPEDFNNIVSYLQSGVFASKYNTSTKRGNLQKLTDENSQPVKKRLIPTYDKELREALIEKFHVSTSHSNTIKHTLCYTRNTSELPYLYPKCINQKKPPIIASAPLERLQMDLVDLLSFAEHNDGYSYILTMVDVFSHYVWVIPLKDKEESMINKKLARHFSMFGPPTELQSDNGC
ncbi:11816_t:CDS:2 [Paraglomus brasilianum]|uniref:11816_t:CDS:1 n=1 Tax=Paraglomus brasilianum TaxID=144538 RepID=A0A9N8W6C8_9GLOM|nr:11816_t:CDS:2 [Paraglomus brasilianum]